jgi:hypothetical protein
MSEPAGRNSAAYCAASGVTNGGMRLTLIRPTRFQILEFRAMFE